ncbi:hypothetical protein [Microcystis aeruginosa]|nr:hypothetical protein [Microcystis aeruginosa]GCL59019.1 hypothetical protein NIES3807_21890 [Microcystis aeruginosa NIES-3807]
MQINQAINGLINSKKMEIFDLYRLNAPLNLPEASLCFQNRDFIVFMERKEFFSPQKPLPGSPVKLADLSNYYPKIEAV